MIDLISKMAISTDAVWNGKDLVVSGNKIAKCTNIIDKYKIYTDKKLGEKKKANTYIVDAKTGEVRLNNLSCGNRKIAKLLRLELKK